MFRLAALGATAFSFTSKRQHTRRKPAATLKRGERMTMLARTTSQLHFVSWVVAHKKWQRPSSDWHTLRLLSRHDGRQIR